MLVVLFYLMEISAVRTNVLRGTYFKNTFELVFGLECNGYNVAEARMCQNAIKVRKILVRPMALSCMV
jgi:hypothetical protein